jgi:hypothetical protein
MGSCGILMAQKSFKFAASSAIALQPPGTGYEMCSDRELAQPPLYPRVGHIKTHPSAGLCCLLRQHVGRRGSLTQVLQELARKRVGCPPVSSIYCCQRQFGKSDCRDEISLYL